MTYQSILNPHPVTISGGVSISGTVPVSGTFYPATQPVSIAASVAVTGPLTDTQLRATAVPVSIASMPSTPVTGTFWQATQPVSGTVTVTGVALDATLTGGTQQSKLTDGTNVAGIATGSLAASEVTTDRLKVNASLRVLDIGQAAGSQLVAAKGDQTSGLWVNVKGGNAPQVDALGSILTELRVISTLLQIGLSIRDEPADLRDDFARQLN